MFVLQGAGHNDVEMFNQYLDRLKKFVTVEIVNRQTETAVATNKTKTTTPANTENQTPISKETEPVAEEANTSTISSISLTSANEKLL